jgi:hypothetical protein
MQTDTPKASQVYENARHNVGANPSPAEALLTLLRQSMSGGAPAWQPWVDLAGIAGCTLLMAFAGAPVFRGAILTQGKPPKATDLRRWAIRG